MPRPPTAAPAGADPPAERLFSDRLGKRAARGDQRAFEAIFKRYHQELYRYCLSIVRDREDAEDALQATMAAALRSLPGEEREIALRPWLYRVAHNESISLLRGRTPAGDAEPEEDLEALTGSVPAEAEQRERLRRLVSDLQTLPERQRSAIVMRELNDLSYAEIGAGLDCSEAAARQTVYEARSALFTFEEGRSMDCEPIREAISSRDGRRLRGRKVRAHLRVCEGCSDFEAVIAQRRVDIQALFPPLPALAASGILAGLVGGTGGGAGVVAAGVGAAGAGGGVLGTGIAGGVAIKGASLVAAAAVAAGAADLGGVVDLPNPFTGNDSDTAREGGGSQGGGSAGASDDAGGASSEQAGGTGSSAEGSAAGANQSHGGSGTANGKGNGNSAGAGSEGGRGGSAAAPGQAGEHGGSATAPGQTGTSPGQSGTAPGQAGTSPGQAGTTPGQSGSSPGKSESAPGHSEESAPGNSGSAPGHTGDAPGSSGSAPGHSESSAPGNSASAPGQVKDAGEPALPPAKPPKVTTPHGGGPPAENPGKGNGPDVGLPPVVGDLAGAAGGLVGTPGN